MKNGFESKTEGKKHFNPFGTYNTTYADHDDLLYIGEAVLRNPLCLTTFHCAD